ncbi:hypothetical protein BBJ29_002182 [Phytophthora kernoviae]|uniref:RxLR effector protein n=1 Tax=Phytophthora kernoviae TaxID=325452 RepID=A0A3F2RV42_9STRA|nr:hypothetical protein BBJ29_002183 [Phytophthora kernoviae]RLN56540.1 hypothetical protein BBJ29_002182 [Phytophthora kernoviae]RLN64806.1 hypothetical protein BBP00_00003227 [Phytophthora kernoviae]RLN64811.1 hypothetical protein BBP00_00003228 [Phytophthora kernoviae]
MWFSTFLLVLFSCVCAAQDASDSFSDSNSAALSTSDSASGSTSDIYNICPVVADFTGEQEDLSDAELKANAADAAMSAYMLSHPNNTLWDYFKIERKQKKEMYKKLPLKERVKKVFKGIVDFTADTIIALAQNLASAIKWIVNTIRDPLVGAKQVANFFKEFGNNCKGLWKLMKEDPKETGKNMGGGLLLHIVHNPSEFTAETVLMPLKACKIPKEYRPSFSSRDLCLSSPKEIRQLIFGTTKRSAKMNQQERVDAYNHFHDFVCCYLQNQEFEVNAPKVDDAAFEAELISTPVKMSNCSLLLANYSDDTVWMASSSDDGSADLDASYEDASDEDDTV